MRFIRRGRASKPLTAIDLDDDARGSGDYDEIGSDIENVDELSEWMSTKPTGHQTQILPGESLIRKYLPPGTVNDLYEHYKSTQKLLGGHTSSFLYLECLILMLCILLAFRFFLDGLFSQLMS